eukprot:TRINITY_DN853_c0_g1_i3.p1 TRINITY_DN853_c0_g1~~TRINITY_DN853_c0_g1_i3.p1  ORF type:complete len:248 (+),score=32.07 TRINITY_DN853_c0_g1_i3:67-810(+)
MMKDDRYQVPLQTFDPESHADHGTTAPRVQSLPEFLIEPSHDDFQPTWCGPLRVRIVEFIESRKFQSFLLGLLILDVLLVVAEVILEWTRQCIPETVEHPGEKPHVALEFPHYWMHQLSEGMHIISIAILIIFEIELLSLLFSLGLHFFTKFMYVLDLIVVTLSLIIDLLLGEVLSSFLLLFRLWRMLRIVHGIYASVEETAKKKHHHQNEQIRILTQKVEKLQKRKAICQQKLEAVRKLPLPETIG